MFLDLETLEPHKDHWASLSTLGRMTPQELKRAADRTGKVAVATEVTRLVTPSSTETRPQAAPVLRARLGAGIRVEQAELTLGWPRRCGMRRPCTTAVLPVAADARLDLQHPPLPAQLR